MPTKVQDTSHDPGPLLHMQGGYQMSTPLSKEWRANTSSIPVIELAQGLKGLSKVIGSVSRDCELVQFGPVGSQTENRKVLGRSTGELVSHTIRIDPDWATKAGQYPIPPENYDVLTGLAVHEASHSKVNSHRINPRRGVDHQDFPADKFYQIAEEVYTDAYVRDQFKVHAQYLDRARSAYLPDPNQVDWSQLPVATMLKHVYEMDFPTGVIPTEHNVIHAVIVGMMAKLTSRPKNKLEPGVRQTLYDNTYRAIVRLLDSTYRTQIIQPSIQDQQTMGLETEPQQIRISSDGTVEKIGDNQSNSEGGSKPEIDMSNLNQRRGENAAFDEDNEDDEEDGEQDEGQGGGSENLDNGEGGQDEHDEGSGSSTEGDVQSQEVDDGSQDSHDPEGNQAGAPGEDQGDDSEERAETGEMDPSHQNNGQPGREYGDGNFHNYAPISKKLVDAIEEAIEAELTDLTDKVNEILDDSQSATVWGTRHGGNLPVTHERSRLPKDTRPPDDKLRRDLDWIKRVQNTIDRVTYRGLNNGKLNKRALHRHYTDNRPYKLSKMTQNQKTDLVLLLDASDSMSSSKAIYDYAQALHQVIPESVVLSYRLAQGVQLEDVAYGGVYREVQIGGTTPSGQAMLGAILKYPKALIIHFTDGAPNAGIDIPSALKSARAKYPDHKIVTIALANRYMSRDQDAFRGNYGPDTENHTLKVIGTVEEFPEALKSAIEPWYRTR